MPMLYVPPNQPIPIPDGVDWTALISFLLVVGNVLLAAVRQRGFDRKMRWEERQRKEKREVDSQLERQQAATDARREQASLFERIIAGQQQTIADLRQTITDLKDQLLVAQKKRDSFLEERTLLQDELDQATTIMKDCQRERELAVATAETYKVKLEQMTAARDGVLVRNRQLERDKAQAEIALKRQIFGEAMPTSWDGARAQIAAARAILDDIEQQFLMLETRRNN